MDEFRLDREKYMLQLEKLKDEESHPVKDVSYLKKFLELDFESVYDSMTIPEKRELWRSVIREIRIDNGRNVRFIFL